MILLIRDICRTVWIICTYIKGFGHFIMILKAIKPSSDSTAVRTQNVPTLSSEIVQLSDSSD